MDALLGLSHTPHGRAITTTAQISTPARPPAWLQTRVLVLLQRRLRGRLGRHLASPCSFSPPPPPRPPCPVVHSVRGHLWHVLRCSGRRKGLRRRPQAASRSPETLFALVLLRRFSSTISAATFEVSCLTRTTFVIRSMAAPPGRFTGQTYWSDLLVRVAGSRRLRACRIKQRDRRARVRVCFGQGKKKEGGKKDQRIEGSTPSLRPASSCVQGHKREICSVLKAARHDRARHTGPELLGCKERERETRQRE
ncbi:hypothetical protein LX36DRAFT_389559 [Colletotrichum falcatum]|nr:hypothetical protein LX36DRAFT_389559 [Colletotrichum falcatum]